MLVKYPSIFEYTDDPIRKTNVTDGTGFEWYIIERPSKEFFVRGYLNTSYVLVEIIK